MGFINTGHLLPTILYNLIYALSDIFIFLLVVRQCLKYSLAKVVISLFIGFVVIETIGFWFPAIVYAALALTILFCFHVVNMERGKILFIILMIANYNWLISTIIQTLGIDHTVFLVTVPFFALLMKKVIWPALCGLNKTELLPLMPLTILLIVLAMFFCSDHFAKTASHEWEHVFYMSMMSAVTFASYYLMLRTLKQTLENTRNSERFRMVDEQLIAQSKRYEEITAHTKEIKVMRHDLRHHKLALSGMLEEKRYDEAKAYLRGCTDSVETMEQPLCSCYAADVIVRRYKSAAEKAGIQTDIQLGLPDKPGIADIDLCIILGNLMENAIKACEKVNGEKLLRVVAKVKDDEVLIAVDNTCSPCDACTDNSSGLGIPSVQAIAKKYGGIAKFDQKDNMFMVSLLLYREK